MDTKPMDELRRCSMCGEAKPMNAFHRRSAGHQRWCKACRKPYDAAYFARTRELRHQQLRARRAGLAFWIDEVKRSQPCVDCGGWFHPEAMEFDHLPGSSKRGAISDLCRRGNTNQVRDEILKCEVVCSNCHAVRTYMRRVYGDSFEEVPARYEFALVA